MLVESATILTDDTPHSLLDAISWTASAMGVDLSSSVDGRPLLGLSSTVPVSSNFRTRFSKALGVHGGSRLPVSVLNFRIAAEALL